MAKKTLRQILGNNFTRSVGKSVFRCCPELAVCYCKITGQKKNRAEAMKLFNEGVTLPEGASREDYFKAMKAQKVSLPEYLYLFKFYNKSEAERNEFISQVQNHALALKLRMKYPDYDNIDLLRFKERSLAYYEPLGLCHRRWLYTPDATYEQFADLIGAVDCIVKPHDASWGLGIYKENRQEGPQVKELYEKCVKQQALVEEWISGNEALQAFHPSSLNTIRLVTIAYNGKALPFGACFRMGRGDMFIDNTHAGGLYAQVNIETGIVESDAVAGDGLRFTAHPDTGLQITGFQIPQWQEIVDACLNAARQTKNIITGWDVTVTDKGEVEVVEANARPDVPVNQSLMEAGYKRRLLDMLSEVTGKKVTI